MCTWVYTAEVTAKRIRERYLRAILRQDIAFFDNVGAGEVTTRIQTDTRMWLFYFRSYSMVSTANAARSQIWFIKAYLRKSPSPPPLSLHSFPVTS